MLAFCFCKFLTPKAIRQSTTLIQNLMQLTPPCERMPKCLLADMHCQVNKQEARMQRASRQHACLDLPLQVVVILQSQARPPPGVKLPHLCHKVLQQREVGEGGLAHDLRIWHPADAIKFNFKFDVDA